MINDFISFAFSILDQICNLSFFQNFIDLLEDLNDLLSQGSVLFTTALQGVYFIFGKNLVMVAVTSFLIIVIFKIVMSIVNVVSQFIP